MILKKLKNNHGESISETLVSSLIAAVSMIIFASMAIASKNIIAESKITIENYHKDKSLINMNDASFKNGDAKLEFSNALINTVIEYTTPLYSNINDDSENTRMILYSY